MLRLYGMELSHSARLVRWPESTPIVTAAGSMGIVVKHSLKAYFRALQASNTTALPFTWFPLAHWGSVMEDYLRFLGHEARSFHAVAHTPCAKFKFIMLQQTAASS